MRDGSTGQVPQISRQVLSHARQPISAHLPLLLYTPCVLHTHRVFNTYIPYIYTHNHHDLTHHECTQTMLVQNVQGKVHSTTRAACVMCHVSRVCCQHVSCVMCLLSACVMCHVCVVSMCHVSCVCCQHVSCVMCHVCVVSMCHVSCVCCQHVSCVMCHVSCVCCQHVAHNLFNSSLASLIRGLCANLQTAAGSSVSYRHKHQLNKLPDLSREPR
jgi:hypothetical protein